MAGAWVVELSDDEKQTERGYFEFVQLPSVGDHLALRNPAGATDLLEVVDIEHVPVLITEAGASDGAEPTVTVFVQWMEQVEGG